MTSSLHAIAELLVLRLLDSLAAGTVICLLAALVLRLAPRQNATTRFALWFFALIFIAALPWITGAVPHELSGALSRSAAITLPESWVLSFLALWAAVTACFALGVVRALRHLHVLRRNCVPVDDQELNPILQETLQRYSGNRQIVFCTSDKVQAPTAVGLFKPAILVPRWVMRDLSPADLNQILLHELAHFRRWDDWTNLAQQIVKALFFFHPAVWWIDKKVAIEREMACDDAVLAETRNARAYAECLAQLAEKSFAYRSITLAQAALGKVRQTSARIAQILDCNRPVAASRSWATAASLVTILAAGCGALYSRTPRLIAFGSPTHVVPARVAALSAHPTTKPESVRAVSLVQGKLTAPETPVKWNGGTAAHRKSDPEPVRFAKPLRLRQTNLVHFTQSTISAAPVTETFWIIVESDDMNPAAVQAYQVQMWRVTVFRTVISAPSRQIPRNET